MKKVNWYSLITIILAIQLGGLISSLLGGDAKALYPTLIKPPFSPPGIVFGIAWTILYTLMGISLYLYLQERQVETKRKDPCVVIFAIQLALNYAWSVVFFRFQAYWAAVAVVCTIIIMVIALIRCFYSCKPVSGVLLIPYLLWLLFAAYLNIGIAMLNSAHI